MGKPEYRVEVLDVSRYRRAEFQCESPELTEFLRARARKEMEARCSACFVLVADSDPGRIVGYYTLSQASIFADLLPAELSRKLPRYREHGATLIGRLARDIAWRGKEIGPLLLMDALRRCIRQSSEVGAVVVVTDPKDSNAKAFYESFGFRPLDSRRLFVPMRELIQLEARNWVA